MSTPVPARVAFSRRRLLSSAVLLPWGRAASAAPSAEPPDAADLVRRADAHRQLYDAAVMRVRLVQHGGDGAVRSSLLRVAVQGSDRSLIQVVEGIDAGQQMLMTAEGLWVRLPRSSRTVRITPMQRLLGEASVGDIGRMRWQDDYDARLATPPEASVGGVAAWNLELGARSDLTTYPRIALSVARSDARPLEATFFLRSGKAVKTVEFGPLERINDRQGIRRMVFRDQLKSGGGTEMQLEQIVPQSLPPRLFALEALGEWR